MEYEVEHVPWRIGEFTDFVFDADVKELYGEAFGPFLTVKPYLVFFAEGSEVSVRAASRLIIERVPPK
ncbi:hypothetical protein GCM10023313_26310 [Mucilaginibacter defluvii]|uniref:Uncharacterized protein n=1 Tax=Mucilaginibacter defluvii TaxID=1196019 RepID=A0ABP9FY68_9SPHI